jgi:hypothetical protein
MRDTIVSRETSYKKHRFVIFLRLYFTPTASLHILLT